MTKIKLRHYVVKRGRGFWQPTKKMCAHGFYPVPCGPDGPDAWAIAEQWNVRWDKTRRGEAPSPAMVAADNLSLERSEELTVYPPRSLGEAFRRYRRTDEWVRKAPRTREDWWRGLRPLRAASKITNGSILIANTAAPPRHHAHGHLSLPPRAHRNAPVVISKASRMPLIKYRPRRATPAVRVPYRLARR
jgi:hypothetical protein